MKKTTHYTERTYCLLAFLSMSFLGHKQSQALTANKSWNGSKIL
ncbi:hypothetical protein [Flavobacterium sp.]